MSDATERFPSYAASALQQMMWVEHQAAPASAAYNVCFPVRLLGHVEPERLGRAVSAAVARHPTLRTTFRLERGALTAVERPAPAGGALEVVSLRDDRGRAAEAVRNFLRRPYDLAEGPTFRAGLFALGDDESIFCLGGHHVALDVQSIGVLLDAIEAAYRPADAGAGASAGAPEGAAYRDFAERQGAYLRSAEAEASRRHWREALAGPFAARGVPSAAATGDRGAGGAIGFFEVSPELRARLEARAGLLRHALWSLFAAFWGAAVARREGRASTVLGFPLNVREAPFERTVGNFVNPLPVALDVPPGARPFDVAKQALAQISKASAHRRLPLSDVVGALRRDGVAVPSPPYGAAMNYLKGDGAGRYTDLHVTRRHDVRVPWAGVELAPFFLPQQEGQVELALEVVESGAGLRGYVRASSAVEAGAVGRLRDELLASLEAFAADAGATAVGARGADAAEGGGAAAGGGGREGGATLVSLFDRVARERPGAVALRDGGANESYGALAARSVGVARALREAGVRPGDRVGVALPPSADFVAAALGAMRAGAAYVPLDPGLPPARLAQIVAGCAVATAVVAPGGAPPGGPRVRGVRLDEAGAGGEPFDLSRGEALAYTLFTSGSTGRPKGIDVRHRNVVALLRATAGLVRTDPSDAWCWFHAPSFDLSVWEVFGALTSGARLVVAGPAHRRDPRELARLLGAEGVTVLQLTPSAMRLLMGVTAGPPPVALKHLVSCGEALPAETADYFLPWARSVWNMYGPAETTVYATYFEVTRPVGGGGYVPIGAALPGYRVRLLDDALGPVADGEAGEIVIAGAGVAAGYANDGAATAARFVPEPGGEPSARMYRTGDYARYEGGALQYLGRRDQQIKVNGYRVDLLEVEEAIRATGRVRDAAVARDGAGGEARLHAFVVPAAGDDGAAVRLGDWLADRLPTYMIPTACTVLPALPLNAHGKVDRAALGASLGAAVTTAAGASPGAAGAGAPARSAGELAAFIADRWRAISGRPDCPPGATFFEMGGDSFMIVRLQNALREHEAFADLQTTDIFKYPKIEALASFAAAGDGADEGGPFRRTASRRPRRAVARKD